MPEKPWPGLSGVAHRLRGRLGEIPVLWREWRREVKEDPGLVWRMPAVRLALVAVVGLVLVFAIQKFVDALTPGSPADFAARATPTATLFVACTQSDCLHEMTVTKPMDFDSWPLVCPRCGQETVYRATLCPRCRKWYAEAPGSEGGCRHCRSGASEEASDRPVEEVPADPDDEEDPW